MRYVHITDPSALCNTGKLFQKPLHCLIETTASGSKTKLEHGIHTLSCSVTYYKNSRVFIIRYGTGDLVSQANKKAAQERWSKAKDIIAELEAAGIQIPKKSKPEVHELSTAAINKHNLEMEDVDFSKINPRNMFHFILFASTKQSPQDTDQNITSLMKHARGLGRQPKPIIVFLEATKKGIFHAHVMLYYHGDPLRRDRKKEIVSSMEEKWIELNGDNSKHYRQFAFKSKRVSYDDEHVKNLFYYGLQTKKLQPERMLQGPFGLRIRRSGMKHLPREAGITKPLTVTQAMDLDGAIRRETRQKRQRSSFTSNRRRVHNPDTFDELIDLINAPNDDYVPIKEHLRVTEDGDHIIEQEAFLRKGHRLLNDRHRIDYHDGSVVFIYGGGYGFIEAERERQRLLKPAQWKKLPNGYTVLHQDSVTMPFIRPQDVQWYYQSKRAEKALEIQRNEDDAVRMRLGSLASGDIELDRFFDQRLQQVQN